MAATAEMAAKAENGLEAENGRTVKDERGLWNLGTVWQRRAGGRVVRSGADR